MRSYHQSHAQPQQWFLHNLIRHQQYLAQIYAGKPLEERGKPLVCAINGAEIGEVDVYKMVDVSRFIIPTSLLHRVSLTDPSAAQSSSILPLLRCVGVAHALRIMAALICERRVLMVSSSPTRLASCSHSAVSMLAQGMLHWQHLYIPVLPPHLWEYLAAPYPYLIGILGQMIPRLDRTDGLGEVLIIHLDSNNLETRNMSQQSIPQRLPDLFVSNEPPVQGAPPSGADILAQDLIEILKTDKKILYGESALASVGETAAKATKAVKQTFFKLRDKGRQFLGKQSSVSGGAEFDDSSGPMTATEPQVEAKSMADDYIYTEGCHNEVVEDDARVAFTAFFLNLVGDMKLYLSITPGQLPRLDRQRFLQQKMAVGERQGTPMWLLLEAFCQTQMLEEFAKARVEEVRLRIPVTPDASLFLQSADYHRKHQIDFGVLSVRRTAKQVAQSSPSRLTGLLQTNARRMAMSLTSNKSYEGEYSQAIAQLVEQCRESTSVLFDVMSVIWLRLRDSKGMRWKHGYQALQLLKNLLYHGPLAAVSEAADGLEKIRALKFYENMRPQCVQQVRVAATHVYDLMVDRARLFFVRRVCADRRREMHKPIKKKLIKDTRMRVTVRFQHIHAAVNPQAHPSAAGSQSFAAASPQAAPSVSSLGSSVAADMAGLFDNMQLDSSVTTGPSSAAANSNVAVHSGQGPAPSVASPAPVPSVVVAQTPPRAVATPTAPPPATYASPTFTGVQPVAVVPGGYYQGQQPVAQPGYGAAQAAQYPSQQFPPQQYAPQQPLAPQPPNPGQQQYPPQQQPPTQQPKANPFDPYA